MIQKSPIFGANIYFITFQNQFNMKFITTFCCALFFLQLNAQGWDRTLTDSLKITSISPTEDGGCIMLGNRITLQKVVVLKVDALGKTQWVKDFSDMPVIDEIIVTGKIKIIQDSDGNYWLGLARLNSGELYLAKLDQNGNRLFFKKIPLFSSVINISGNQLLAFGRNINNIWTSLRLKTNGDTLDVKSFPEIKSVGQSFISVTVQKSSFIFYGVNDSTGGMQSRKIGFDGTLIALNVMPFNIRYFSPFPPMVKTSDGGLLVPDSSFITKLDSNGKFVWRKIATFSNSIPGGPFPFGPYNYYLMAGTTANGGFIAIQNNPSKKSLTVRKYSSDCILQTTSIWYYENTVDYPFMIRTAKGGYLIAGNTMGTKVRLIKLDENGYFYPNFIKGNVFSDRDNNCRLSGNDILLQKVVMVAKRAGFSDALAMTDTLGKYNLNVDVGTYEVSIVNPNKYMDPCTPSVLKTISTTNTLDSFDFPLKSTIFCGVMQVDVATPRLRRCFNNNYTVSYCNKGSATALGAYVNITLDSLLEFVSADKSVASKTGRTYRFNLGDMAINDCQTFDIVARVRCGDSTRLGQTICVDAKIYPDTICGVDNTLWTGANLVVNGSCQGDSVVFQVQNTGKVASPASLSVVVENANPVAFNIASLAVNGVFTKKFPSNGNTWRMVVNQVPNHPRSIQPTAFVEGCRRNQATPFVTGFAAGYASDDSNISVDSDCQPIIGAFDPNDKIGYPLGRGITKGVNQNQDIEYMIRFQNTGTDTAFTVVIRDTIDANLEIKSIEWGASSHKYVAEIYGQNILKFTFNNILLVDSFKNEPKSNGYIKYRIQQKKDVAFGTKIQNSAGIYFDFNDPVLTNKTLHTVSKNVVSAIIDLSKASYPTVKVYPNPTTETMFFELTDTPLSKTTFDLYDMTGKRVNEEQFEGKTFEFHRQALPSGVYLFKMTADSQIVGTGKLMIQ